MLSRVTDDFENGLAIVLDLLESAPDSLVPGIGSWFVTQLLWQHGHQAMSAFEGLVQMKPRLRTALVFTTLLYDDPLYARVSNIVGPEEERDPLYRSE